MGERVYLWLCTRNLLNEIRSFLVFFNKVLDSLLAAGADFNGQAIFQARVKVLGDGEQVSRVLDVLDTVRDHFLDPLLEACILLLCLGFRQRGVHLVSFGFLLQLQDGFDHLQADLLRELAEERRKGVKKRMCVVVDDLKTYAVISSRIHVLMAEDQVIADQLVMLEFSESLLLRIFEGFSVVHKLYFEGNEALLFSLEFDPDWRVR